MVMNHDDTIIVEFGNGDFITAPGIYQYDHGLTLHVIGVTASQIQQAHATSDAMKSAFLLTPTNSGDGIDIPLPDLLTIHKNDVYVYLYTESNDKGFTQRTIRIPLVPRNEPDIIELDNPYFYEANRIAHEIEALTTVAEAAASDARDALEDAQGVLADAQEAVEDAQEAVGDAQTLLNTLVPLTNNEIDTLFP